MKLISMTDFVEKSRDTSNVTPFDEDQKEIDSQELLKIYKYANFLKKPISLSMFIPCDDKNTPIEEITSFDPDISSQYYASQLYHNQLFENAKAKILFKGFVIVHSSFGETVSNGKINYDLKQANTYNVIIEELVKDNLILTESAIKYFK